MSNEVKILMLEDQPTDAELVQREIAREGIKFIVIRVDSKDGFLKALLEFQPELVLADYSIPGFDSMEALRHVRRMMPGIPFVLVTGSVSEEVAVACMKEGADDYVIKEHLVRIGPAVKHALEQKRIREDKKKIEEQLMQLQKMESMGQLAGGIAHDFNNLLAGILGYTRLALQDLPEKCEARDNLEEVIKAGARGRDLVEQILTFSRQSKGTVKRAPHSLASVVKNTLKFLRPTLPSTVEIKEDLPEELPPALVDPTQIHQVIVNLCVNACHAMQNKGHLTLTLSRTLPPQLPDMPATLSRDYLLLEVRDNGHGMDEQTRNRIFEPFFTTKKRGEGTGMGLAIVFGIIRSHDAFIHVESQQGHGTTFRIHFPITDAESPKERHGA